MQDVGQSLDAHERVADVCDATQEGVLAHVELHARVQRQHDQLARGVPGEGDPARAVGQRDDERHAAEAALDAAAGVHRRQRRLLVLPQHHVVLEEDRVALRPGSISATGTSSPSTWRCELREAELGHVAQPRRLAPARVADHVAGVQRRAAGGAAGGARLVLAMAPLALDQVHDAEASTAASGRD